MRTWWMMWVALVVVCASHGVAWAEDATVSRHALVIGANEAKGNEVTLRWAVSDARRVGALLEHLGRVPERHVEVLSDPSVDAVRGALRSLEERLRGEAGVRSEVVVYYSGHANERGLMLSNGTLGYDELRAAMDALSAELGVVIVDACASGNLTRGKGGAHIPAIAVDGSEVRGRVYLTSASDAELAQESDTLRGSIFTHYILSGMRGAADVSGDRRVTLSELYQFAFDETLRRTRTSRLGAQHATFDITLVGEGELVLTSLDERTSQLTLSSGVEGTLLVWDAREDLVAEFYKLAGSPARLGVEPGVHEVYLRRGGAVEVARVEVAEQSTTIVTPRDFAPAPRAEWMRARGDVDVEVNEDQLFRIGLETLRDESRRTRRVQAIGAGSLLAISAGTLALAAASPEDADELVLPGVTMAFIGAPLLVTALLETQAERQAARLLAQPSMSRSEGWALLEQQAVEHRRRRRIGATMMSSIGAGMVAGGVWLASSDARIPGDRGAGIAFATMGGVVLGTGVAAWFIPSKVERLHDSLEAAPSPSAGRLVPTLGIDPRTRRVGVGLSFTW